MLMEQVHHMFVGETGTGWIIKSALEMMKELDTNELAKAARGSGD